jgi:hypothetical protein
VTERAPCDAFVTMWRGQRIQPPQGGPRHSVQGYALVMTANFLESNGCAFHAYLPGFGVRCSMRQPSERQPSARLLSGPCSSAEHHGAGSLVHAAEGWHRAHSRVCARGRRGASLKRLSLLPGTCRTSADTSPSRRFQKRAQISSLREDSQVAPEILSVVASILHCNMRVAGDRRNITLNNGAADAAGR